MKKFAVIILISAMFFLISCRSRSVIEFFLVTILLAEDRGQLIFLEQNGHQQIRISGLRFLQIFLHFFTEKSIITMKTLV